MESDRERVIAALYNLLNVDTPSPDDVSVGYLAELAAAEIRASREQLLDWETREACCCPEDVGFEEHIANLTRRIALPSLASAPDPEAP